MICPCGGQCSEHEVKAGTAIRCTACGRYEVFPMLAPITEEDMRWAQSELALLAEKPI